MTVHPSALTWLLLAAAAASVGGVGGGGPRPEPAVRRPMSRRTAVVLVASAVLLACGVVLGAARGLLVGAAMTPVAVAIVRRLHDRAPPTRPNASLALTLDLVSIALRSGQPLDAALALAAEPATRTGLVLLRVAGLLRLGADADQAWQLAEDDPVLARVAATARRSATSGTRLAGGFERLATELREEIRAAAQGRAHRVGVLAAAPLGLCFLPAFVCLGIVPIIVGIAGGVLTH
jgi:Flp pilus assembly protein TadB